ncbi:MAG: hypothetical protein LIP23_01220 [Planctomycetes bacterium]|nr:hypothetical protein [Planctomycetota bacterium]
MAKQSTKPDSGKKAMPPAKRKSQPKKRPELLKLQNVEGYPSWKIASDQVEVVLAQRGGHMAPVTFFRNDGDFAPLAIAPWSKDTKAKYDEKHLSLLRGDFFCMPFGGNATPYKGEKFPAHGETSNNDWRLADAGRMISDCECGCDAGYIFMVAEMRTKIRKAKVEKLIAVKEGEQAVYICHDISGMSGPMPYGHHAMLQWKRQGAGLISLSKFKYGQVFPGAFEDPAQGGYHSLKAGAMFTSLNKVPTLAGGNADLTVYPARAGFEDLVMVCSDGKGPFAWSAAVYPEERMVWFALKDPAKLASTVLWHSNGGRHYHPWSGRHVGVLGIEEVTAYFHYGIDASVKANPVSKKGIPTYRNFIADETFSIPYVMAAAKIPARFDHVETIEPVKDDSVRLVSKSGKKVTVKVGWQFVSPDE